MSRVFVDTSAVMALLVSTEDNHIKAKSILERLAAQDTSLYTTSYVLVELYALIGRRFGPRAVETFRADMAPLFKVTWIDEELHEAGLDLLSRQKRRRLSLVDAVSFVFMNQKRITDAFAFDSHFRQGGFNVL